MLLLLASLHDALCSLCGLPASLPTREAPRHCAHRRAPLTSAAPQEQAAFTTPAAVADTAPSSRPRPHGATRLESCRTGAELARRQRGWTRDEEAVRARAWSHVCRQRKRAHLSTRALFRRGGCGPGTPPAVLLSSLPLSPPCNPAPAGWARSVSARLTHHQPPHLARQSSHRLVLRIR